MKQTLRIILASFLVTAAVIKAAPVIAEPAPAQNVSIVHTADLNLSTESGRRQLDQRLVIAAGEVCGTGSDTDLKGKNDVRKCRHDVLSEARAKGAQLASSALGGSEIKVAAAR
jgi:UrcA family protein